MYEPYLHPSRCPLVVIAAHEHIFLNIADRLHCCIMVREPNDLLERWFGKRVGGRWECIPKPATVKAKSADNANHELGGLVVNPELCPGAFTPLRLDKAMATWKKWSAPSGITSVREGPCKGLVLLHGKAIFPDYDLFDVTLLSRDARMYPLEFDSPREAADLVKTVTRAFNTSVGIDMIRHGPETHWLGMGTTGDEQVICFSPGRRRTVLMLPELTTAVFTKGVHLRSLDRSTKVRTGPLGIPGPNR